MVDDVWQNFELKIANRWKEEWLTRKQQWGVIYGPNEELTLSEQELERNGRNL